MQVRLYKQREVSGRLVLLRGGSLLGPGRFVVLEEAQVASLTDSTCVQFSVTMLTVSGQLEPSLRVVAVPTETLGVVIGICVLALCHFALCFLVRSRLGSWW